MESKMSKPLATNSVELTDTSIRPFRITIPQSDLDDLQARLTRTRWPDELPGTVGKYGVSLEYMKELVEYWRNSYDWRKHEKQLNEYPQFTITIDGTNVHFLHVRSPEPDAMPLILNHGWPGSILEFLNVIDLLTNPRTYGGNPSDAFHLVIPSMPGYGFSGPTNETGWDVHRIARAWIQLMDRLGYDNYAVHGGDFGSVVALNMGQQAPDHICGIHLNFLPMAPSGDLSDLSEEDKARIAKLESYLAAPAGHKVIQSTRPQTLAYGLTDSPVGQLAWIAEKFTEWSDPIRSIDRDLLLTNVMLYWLSGTAASSSRLHYESATIKRQKKPCSVPIGIAVFSYDLFLPVRRLAERQYNIVHWSEFDCGGHFAAIEAPDLLSADIKTCFRRFR
ncbi:epoxide hydrolase [Paenibacillus sp. KQZ6P-2]|uniref:Epoxide hydrolase n=1 Tax=Paenibacillus mangrovi TaxID=2931978 RepID=A0A9X2B693_9BACL|nr:epoxide hydrolase family protein [Paenibacillus mangrovi]MCJ8012468.1 epoxide hydrolase [Paenibacillus mangrovi]